MHSAERFWPLSAASWGSVPVRGAGGRGGRARCRGGLLLTLDRGGMLWWLLRGWQHTCELAEYLSELLEEGCDLRSAEHEPLALLQKGVLEEDDASRRFEDNCVRTALVSWIRSCQCWERPGCKRCCGCQVVTCWP
jgi:hypothetical protein